MRSKSLVMCLALKDAAAEALSKASADGPRALDERSEESLASTLPSEHVDDTFSKIDSWGKKATAVQLLPPTAV